MELILNEEQVMLRNMARQFANRSIEPTAMDDDRNEHFPWEIIKEMVPLGLLGVTIPHRYGGHGLDHISSAIVIEEIAHASLSITMSVFCAHLIVAETCAIWGSEEQKRKYLPPMCKGDIFGCYALDKSSVEIRADNICLTARKSDKSWVLNGEEAFVINGGVSNLALVLAKTNEDQSFHSISAFLVSRDVAGFSSRNVLGRSGIRACDVADIHLLACRVPEENLLGNINDGREIGRNILDSINFAVAASCVGIAQACIDTSTRYAEERRAFGKPIGSFGMVQNMIADMIVGTEAARLLTYEVADLKDRGQPFRQKLSIARYVASMAALQTVKDTVQVHGAYGYEKGSAAERYFRDVTQVSIYGGTPLMHKLAVTRSSPETRSI